MTNKPVKTRNDLLFISVIIFQIVFLLEIFLFLDDIVVDPSVHRIGFTQWEAAVSAWDATSFWGKYSDTIIVAVKTVNVFFQLLFDTALLYILVKKDRFSLNRIKALIGYLLVVLLSAAIGLFIKYHVDFYRIYMYSIFTELLAVYMLLLARHTKCVADTTSPAEGNHISMKKPSIALLLSLLAVVAVFVGSRTAADRNIEYSTELNAEDTQKILTEYRHEISLVEEICGHPIEQINDDTSKELASVANQYLYNSDYRFSALMTDIAVASYAQTSAYLQELNG